MTTYIRLLDDKTINKIAAGEVVERPASVIKELVENSIDALSSSITIEIKDGGKKYIRVTDNGTGINKDDIELAFLRHSTSKINNIDDLQNVMTLGFRGEALASISSVSQLELITKTKSDMSGSQLVINGGIIKEKNEVGCPDGTTLIVKNLFYNVPVRQKFLKSNNVESSYIGDIIYKLALSNPQISFKYIKDNKMILKTPGKGNLISTSYSLFGKEFVDSMFELKYSSKGLSIEGLICKPSFTRGNRGYQHIFVNGRYIKDEGISRVIEKVYKSLIPINRYPVFILFIKLSSNDLDVNVHPTKTEVRFSNRDYIESNVFTCVKNLLTTNNLIPEVILESEPKLNNKTNNNNIEEQVTIDIIDSPNKIKNSSNIINESQLEKNNNWNKTNNNIREKRLIDELAVYRKGKDQNAVSIKDINENIKVIDFNVKETKEADSYLDKGKDVEDISNKNVIFPELNIIGKLFETYILCEDKKSKDFYIIDQHAAHERIMYEKIKSQLESDNVYVQELMSPEVIDLTHNEINLIKENYDVFDKLGFKIEEFGSNSIIIRSVPMVFGEPNSKQLFLDILDNLQDDITNNYELRLDKVMKMACTNAIKAGYNIHTIEINKLIEDLKLCNEAFTCPHGRPVIIKMSKYELERKFKRT
ncbi:DNA mismatch repair protein MutL [Gottschalkia purinilytica]|uniref:DNA mismatch repair protein MutL n=1 Tax=Gottschalkia purinilytica TaxID=1503 RepID=A0A0L0WBU3_GOTPU|nr:DNA mismatch repair endonuclease MutL [Gottschalkia purinilytica]KNF08922.1 DNA mismatch repair protein MutL [Gottschalkia purinilytica]